MEVFGLGLKIKEEGAATVEASIKRLGAELAKTVLTVGAVTGAFKKLVTETAESQRVQTQLQTVLRSTNGVSGQTIQSLNAQAEALMRVSAFGDEAIGSAQALLLRFTNIRDVFAETVQVTLDLGQAMEGDLRGAAQLLGKALNDPERGLRALRAAGVTFTDDQEELIKRLVATNDLLGAQRVILAQTRVAVEGQAEAYRNTLGGALAALGEQFGNLFEASNETGATMVQAINGFTNVLIKAQPLITGVISGIIKLVVALGTTFTVIGTAIIRIVMGIGTVIVNMILTPLSLIPGLSGPIVSFLDTLNTKAAAADQMMAAFQVTLKSWRGEVLAGTNAAEQFNNALGGGEGGAAGGGMGARRAPTAAELGERTGTTAFTREQFGPGRDRRAELIRGMIPQFGAIAISEADALAVQLQTTFQETIGNALVGGIVGGIEQAVASGNIGQGFKALTSMLLAGIGDAMIKFGTSTAAFSQFMAKIQAALVTLNPAAGLAASLALIGVGAALKGAARGMFGGQGGGSAGSISSFGGNLGGFASNLPTQQIIFGQTSATTAAGMQPRQPMNVTVIGPNDPTAQRSIQELMVKANSRGRIG